MDVFVPALVFAKLVGSDFGLGDYIPLVLGSLAVILGSGALLWPIVSRTPVQAKTFVPPMMFSNAANIGLPLQVLAFGDQALPAAVVMLLMFNLMHFSLGIYILDHKSHWLNTFKQPVIIAGIAAIAFKMLGWEMPSAAATPINMLGDVCVPLMLFSLGVRLTTAELNDVKLGVVAGITAPVVGLIIATGFIAFYPMDHALKGNLLLFAALPPAVMNFIFSERFNQEPEKVASIVMIGNIMAIVTLPLALAYVLPRFG
jgi:predicted permease